jgi:hypothetical protein
LTAWVAVVVVLKIIKWLICLARLTMRTRRIGRKCVASDANGWEGRQRVLKTEQETIIRWDQDERLAELWTCYEPDARRWARAGFEVKVYASNSEGMPMSWSAQVPSEAIRYRRVQDGKVVRRKGHRKGRLLGVDADQLLRAEA